MTTNLLNKNESIHNQLLIYWIGLEANLCLIANPKTLLFSQITRNSNANIEMVRGTMV